MKYTRFVVGMDERAKAKAKRQYRREDNLYGDRSRRALKLGQQGRGDSLMEALAAEDARAA